MPTEVMTKPICKTTNCKRELTYLEESDCWRCLVCNPLTAPAPTEKPESKYIDVKMTEKKVREIVKDEMMGSKFDEGQIRDIVRDELENWHIQKPPVTKTESELTVAKLREIAKDNPPKTGNIEVPVNPELAASPNWRQQAKELGIPLFQRKKADVLADIEAKKAG